MSRQDKQEEITLKVASRSVLLAGTLMLGCIPAAHGQRDHGDPVVPAEQPKFGEFRRLNPGIDARALRAIYNDRYDNNPNTPEHPYNIIPIFPPTNPNPNPSGAPPIPRVNTLSSVASGLEEGKLRSSRSYQSLGGRQVSMGSGVDIDLASSEANIRLGTKLFGGESSVQIKVGDALKTLTVGSRVTASEYLAAKQVLSGEGQLLVLDKNGTSVGGAVDFASIAVKKDRLNIEDLSIPVNVTAFGDFGKNQIFKVTGDFVNAGSVYAYSSSDHARRSNLAADNIINQNGATITTELPTIYTTLGFSETPNPVDLNLRANDTISNEGTISSSGNLTLSAGGIVENAAGGSIVARRELTITAPQIENAGTIKSISKNVTLDGPFNSELHVNNEGGNIIARNGAINIRNADFVGAYNTYVTGGNLYSNEVNVNAGRGSAEIDVDEMTGTLNQKGLASHVATNTATLSLGNICLTGDPTYSNSGGSISIDGNITVGEALTIIASGDVFNTAPSTITANNATQGFDVTIIAGAQVTAGGTTTNVGPIPPAPAGVITTINGNPSATGGNILFNQNNDGNVVNINTRSSGKTDANGGNVRLSAFSDGSGDNGNIRFFGGAITTGGRGSGNNGNVIIISGAGSSAIFDNALPAINTTGGTGSGGDIVYTIRQPDSAGNITFAADGSLSAGSHLTPSGSINRNIDTDITGALTAPVNIEIESGLLRFPEATKFGMTTVNRSTGIINLDVEGMLFNNSNFFSTNTLDISTVTADIGLAGVVALQTDAANIDASGSLASSSIVIVSSNKNLVLWSGSAFELNLGSVGTFMSNPGSGPITGTNVLIGSFSVGTGLNRLNPVEVDAANLFVTAGKKGDVYAHNSHSGLTTLLDTTTMVAKNVFSIVSDDDLAMSNQAVISAGNVEITTDGDFVNFNGTVNAGVSVTLTSDGNISNTAVPAALNTPLLNLRSLNGDIGSNVTRYSASAGTASINTFTPNGDTYLQGPAGVKSFGLAGGFASGVYDYLGAGSTAISGSLVTETGSDINIVTATGTLSTKSGAEIVSGNDMLLQITDNVSTKIKISLASNTVLRTAAAAPPDGDITLALGSVVNMVPGLPPAKGVSFAEVNGTIFWGAAGITGKGANTVIADNADVIFSNAISSKSISLGGGVTIYADPPVAQSVAASAVSFAASAPVSSSDSFRFGFDSQILEKKTPVLSQSNVISAGVDTKLADNIGGMLPQVSPSLDLWQQSALNIITASQASSQDLDENAETYLVSSNPQSVFYSGSICSDRETYGAIADGGEHSNPALGGVSFADVQQNLTVGRTLFVPDNDLDVATTIGKLRVSAGAIVLVSSDADGVAVYNLHDKGRNSVTIEIGGKTVAICPGRHLLATRSNADFARVNHIESVQHRDVRSQALESLTVHTSEFSTLSAMAAILPLRAIIDSRHAESRKLSNKLMKTTAVLLHLGGNQGEFSYFVKPRLTALR